MPSSWRSILLTVLLATFLLAEAEGGEPPWILVDTGKRVITVRQDGKELDRFADIAIGRGGVTYKRYAGDDKTPLGRFRVAWINPDSPFRLFFGFDYPNAGYARWAWAQGWIDEATFHAIQRAIRNHEMPPQDTALGGYIGIHGLGDADPDVHRRFNWTRGCIAVTNRQVDRLAHWIKLGTRVEVR